MKKKEKIRFDSLAKGFNFKMSKESNLIYNKVDTVAGKIVSDKVNFSIKLPKDFLVIRL